ncbi:MAG: sugar fermentation stimulation protein [Porticoccaceae bacterium]|nr:MAG: sugar fermentation stimulation protein [Porticoccaceae bacterium]
MRFDPPLLPATLLGRRQRFFADVRLACGTQLAVHCPNTGSMLRCLVPNSPCYVSLGGRPGRRLPGTLEIVTTAAGHLAGVNTTRANRLVREALEAGRVAELSAYRRIRAEVPWAGSRLDFLLEGEGLPKCFLEVKNVTLETPQGHLVFPDAPTARGRKHLEALVEAVRAGHRAALFFCVQHSAAASAGPAAAIDPHYTAALERARALGVEVLAYACRLSAREIAVERPIPYRPYAVTGE